MTQNPKHSVNEGFSSQRSYIQLPSYFGTNKRENHDRRGGEGVKKNWHNYFKANIGSYMHHFRSAGHSVQRPSTMDSWIIPNNPRNTGANRLPRTKK